MIDDPNLLSDVLGATIPVEDASDNITIFLRNKYKENQRKIAEAKKNKPMSVGEQTAYMREVVKNQSTFVGGSGMTMKEVRALPHDKLIST